MVTFAHSMVRYSKSSSSVRVHLHWWHPSRTSVHWMTSRFWSSPDDVLGSSFALQEVCLGTCTSPENLWANHLCLCLSLFAMLDGCYVGINTELSSYHPGWEEQHTLLTPPAQTPCMICLYKLPCHALLTCHALFSYTVCPAPGLLHSLIAAFLCMRSGLTDPSLASLAVVPWQWLSSPSVAIPLFHHRIHPPRSQVPHRKDIQRETCKAFLALHWPNQ